LKESEDVLDVFDRLSRELRDLELTRRERHSAHGAIQGRVWFEDEYLPRFVRDHLWERIEPTRWQGVVQRGLEGLAQSLTASLRHPAFNHIDTDRAHIEEILRLADEVGEPAHWVDAANVFASHLLVRAEFGPALDLLLRALRKADAMTPVDMGRLSRTLTNLAKAHRLRGAPQEARECLQRAFGQLTSSLGGEAPALGLLEGTLAVVEEHGAEQVGREFLAELAEQLEQQGDAAGAERLLQRSLTQQEAGTESGLLSGLQTESNFFSELQVVVSLARVKLRLGDAGGAAGLLERALERLEHLPPAFRIRAPDTRILSLMTMLASAYRNAGDEVRADALAERVRALTGSRPLESATRLHARQDLPAPVRAEGMRQLVHRAVAEDNLAEAARAALLRVDLEGRQGAWERAREAADQALQLARRAGDDPLVAEAYRLHADASLHGSLYEDARMGYEEAIRRYDALGNVRMAASARSLLVALLLQLRRLEGLDEHVEWLREYLRGGAAPEDEQREMGELLKLADALPPRQAGARDPSP
jgi:tetratricopeptide (TPR) repeat protein